MGMRSRVFWNNCKKQEERIALLEDYDQYVEDLSLRCRKAEEELKKASLKLSKIRKKQAGLLETENRGRA